MPRISLRLGCTPCNITGLAFAATHPNFMAFTKGDYRKARQKLRDYKWKRASWLKHLREAELDREELKSALLRLPCIVPIGSDMQAPAKPSDSYANYVNRSIVKVERRIKVLSYPTDCIQETYVNLIEEDQRSEVEL